MAIRLIDGNGSPHNLNFIAYSGKRQVSADAHHILGITAGQHADDCRCRRRICHTKLPDAKQRYAVFGQLMGIADNFQQQFFGLRAAHCRALGNIAAAACHAHIHHARNRFSINTDVNHMYLCPRLRGQDANAGGSTRHIGCLNSRNNFRRNGNPFIPHAVIGAHHQHRFAMHVRHTLQARHSGQLHGERFKPTKTSRRFKQSVDMLLCTQHRSAIR